MVAWALVKSKGKGNLGAGLWSAATLTIDLSTRRVLGIYIQEPEFLEPAAERLGAMIAKAAIELKGQPIDRGQ